MTRLLSILLIAVLTLPACAVRSTARLELAPAAVQAPARWTPQSAEQWKRYLDRIPAGSKVKVTFADGRRLGAVLMMVEADRVVVTPRTRIPEPPIAIPFDTLTVVELDSGGIGVGKTVAIAFGAAGAAIGTLFLLALAYAGS